MDKSIMGKKVHMGIREHFKIKVRSSHVTRALTAQLQKLLCSCLYLGNLKSLQLVRGTEEQGEDTGKQNKGYKGRRISLHKKGNLLCSRKRGLI